jgi:hypothetical protein
MGRLDVFEGNKETMGSTLYLIVIPQLLHPPLRPGTFHLGLNLGYPWADIPARFATLTIGSSTTRRSNESAVGGVEHDRLVATLDNMAYPPVASVEALGVDLIEPLCTPRVKFGSGVSIVILRAGEFQTQRTGHAKLLICLSYKVKR